MEESRGRSFLKRFDTGVYALLSVLLVFVPFAVSLSRGVLLEAGKLAVLSLFGWSAFVLWLLSVAAHRKLVLPKTVLLPLGICILGVTLLSSLLSPAPHVSLFGLGQEVSTFIALLLLFILGFLYSLFFQTAQKISLFLFAFYVSVIAVFAMLVYHLLLPGIFPLGFLVDPTANVVGKWNDLGVFFGLGAFLSFVSIEIYKLSGFFKILVRIVLAASLLGLMMVNFYLSWILIALLTAGVLVYQAFIEKGAQRRVSILGVVVLSLSLIFIFLGRPTQSIGRFLASLGIPSSDAVRPSFTPTMDLARGVLERDPILGVGPNRFSSEWFLNRPAAVNRTQYWNTFFSFGVGFIPTTLVTGGLLGFGAWVMFLVAFLIAGFRATLKIKKTSSFYSLTFVSWIAAAYLWIFTVVYVPNTTLLFLAFAFTGLFIGACIGAEHIGTREISFSSKSPFGMTGLIVVGIVVILSGMRLYGGVVDYIALKHSGEGMVLGTQGNLPAAREEFKAAIRWNSGDEYYRLLAQAGVARLNSIATAKTGDIEALRAEFNQVGMESLAAARAVTDRDPSNFINWLTLGDVYQALLGPGVVAAYDYGEKAYAQALTLSPGNPAIYLGAGRLEVAHKDYKKAEGYVAAALKEKPDFSPALVLLAQLAARNGNLDISVKAAEQAVLASPGDVFLRFQLGFFNYLKKDYTKSSGAFEQALTLQQDYSSARFFLGLSYAALKESDKALKEFDTLLALTPENQQVQRVIQNIREGKPALDSIPEFSGLQ